MSTTNPAHVTANRQTKHWAVKHFGEAFVRAQDPLILDLFNEPEPDIVVTKEAEDAYSEIHPTATEVHLAVEISDSTLDYDLSIKARLYSAAGVVEYWVVDLQHRRLHVHQEPTASGYARILTLAESQSIAPLAKPEATVAVTDLLP